MQTSAMYIATIVNGYVAVDGRLAGELHLTPSRGVKEAVFYIKPDDIASVQNIIARVASQASDFKPEGLERNCRK